MNSFNLKKLILIALPFLLLGCVQEKKKEWKPNTDWGHWVLGQKADLDFLKKNNMTITFGSGAPNFESVSRAKFDSLIQAAKKFNKSQKPAIITGCKMAGNLLVNLHTQSA